MNGKNLVRGNKIKLKKKIKKIAKLALLILMLLLLALYVVIGFIYNSGNFTITLDRTLYYEKGIIIYDDNDYKVFRSELFAKSVESFDNISQKWLPEDIDKNEGGSHNGDNYIAYTFYVENLGEHVTNYWSEIIITDVIKNVDEAVRIRVYKDGNYTTYAKMAKNGQPEKDTVPFQSDTVVAMEKIENSKPGDINKYTMVIWLEGSDPECTDNILGGEIKIQMSFNSEIIER